MTASHLQTIPPGPVQLIGLPRTAMGMTTSARISHRRMLVNNNNNNVSSAKRCLFGSPEPGEMKKLYQEEMRKNREHFIKRYNYDIVNEKFVDDDNTIEQKIIDNNDNEKSTNSKDDKLNNTNNDTKTTTIKIEQNCNNNKNDEIVKRLHEAQSDKISSTSSSSLSLSSSSINSKNSNQNDSCDVTTCNLNNNVPLLEIENENNNTTIKTSPSDITSSEATATSTTPSNKDKKTNERLKPYSRQILLTDYYSTRKLFSTKTTTIIVRQLPKPQKAGLHEQSKKSSIQHQSQQQQTEDV